MGPPSHMRSVVDRNVVMWRIPVILLILSSVLNKDVGSWRRSCIFKPGKKSSRFGWTLYV